MSCFVCVSFLFLRYTGTIIKRLGWKSLRNNLLSVMAVLRQCLGLETTQDSIFTVLSLALVLRVIVLVLVCPYYFGRGVLRRRQFMTSDDVAWHMENKTSVFIIYICCKVLKVTGTALLLSWRPEERTATVLVSRQYSYFHCRCVVVSSWYRDPVSWSWSGLGLERYWLGLVLGLASSTYYLGLFPSFLSYRAGLCHKPRRRGHYWAHCVAL